jgi:hypothetical protein
MIARRRADFSQDLRLARLAGLPIALPGRFHQICPTM